MPTKKPKAKRKTVINKNKSKKKYKPHECWCTFDPKTKQVLGKVGIDKEGCLVFYFANGIKFKKMDDIEYTS